MKNRIFKLIKISGLVFITVIIGMLLYYALWFLEYYHLPPISFVKVEPERTKLIDGIESYQSVDEVEELLNRRSLQWEEKNSLPSPKSRPPFQVDTIIIKNYSHLGFTGELTVSFFNNRSTGALFYPTDTERYLETLNKTIGTILNMNQEAKLPFYTKVRFATDYKGQKYILWSDIRLDKEIDLWIKRYS